MVGGEGASSIDIPIGLTVWGKEKNGCRYCPKKLGTRLRGDVQLRCEVAPIALGRRMRVHRAKFGVMSYGVAG